MDLFQGTHADLSNIMDKVYDELMPVYIHGTFGIGKTKGMEIFARKKAKDLGLEFSKSFKDINDPKKFCFIALILHQYDAGEIKGIPFPSQDRTHTVYLPVGLLPEKGQGIIFFDEMNLASPMMQNNAYQLIEDRRLGSYVVPKGYLTIGAGNLVDDRGNTFDMPMPLNNRFLHFQLNVPKVDDIEKNGVTHKGWVNDYALPNGIDNRIVNYLLYQSGDLYKYKPEANIQTVAVATPRMWEKVSKMIKGVPDLTTVEMYTSLGVGPGVAASFVAWLKLSSSYDIKAIFEGKKDFDIPDDVGVRYSLISALVSHYLEKSSVAVGKTVDSPESTKIGELSVRLLKIATSFNKEHTLMFLSQALATDKLLLKRLRKCDPKLFAQFTDDIFKFLI